VIQQFSLAPYFQGTGEYLECVAVSATSSPTGAWYQYWWRGRARAARTRPRVGLTVVGARKSKG
jgi:hypothetical protein